MKYGYYIKIWLKVWVVFWELLYILTSSYGKSKIRTGKNVVGIHSVYVYGNFEASRGKIDTGVSYTVIKPFRS